MTRTERTEAARRLRELAHEIYDTLEEMEAILEVVAPEELELAEKLELARVYWMAHRVYWMAQGGPRDEI